MVPRNSMISDMMHCTKFAQVANHTRVNSDDGYRRFRAWPTTSTVFATQSYSAQTMPFQVTSEFGTCVVRCTCLLGDLNVGWVAHADIEEHSFHAL